MHDRPNHPTIDSIRLLPIGEITKLPADHLALLQEEARAAIESCQARQRLDRRRDRVALRTTRYRRTRKCRQGHRCRSLHRRRRQIVAELPKRVDWDQARLAEVVERIRAAGDDPAEYVEITYKVPERAYTAWPAHIRDAFSLARTVRAGKATFQLSLDAAQGGS